MSTFMSARTSVLVGSLPLLLLACAKDIPTLGGAPIPLLSHSARRVLYGGTQAENKPTHLSWAAGTSRAIPLTGDLEAYSGSRDHRAPD